MEEIAKKKKKEKKSKLLNWITLIFLLLGLIGGSVLIYKERDRQQQLEAKLQEIQEIRDKVQQQYQLQELNLISTAELVDSPAIHSFFSDLLKTYAKRFAERKKIDISQLPLKFKSLYSDPKNGSGYGNMGRCFPRQVIYPTNQKEINISLNRLYLLNKFGHDKYFTNYLQGDYSYLDISFSKMLETCSHEISHYIQLVKWGRSSCESDLILRNGKYSEGLAKEHKEFTGEIYQMIREEISEWERRWKEI